jgi:hypothetical protein
MQLPSVPALGAALIALASLAGCGGDDDVPLGPDAAVGSSCDTNQDQANLDWIQENVFSPSCADFSVCHMGRALMAGELSLEPEDSHAQLVGQPSTLFSQFQRVVPGDPAASYLMVILGHADGPIDEEAGTMPYNSPLLSFEAREAIWCWIEAGAVDPSAAQPDAGL